MERKYDLPKTRPFIAVPIGPQGRDVLVSPVDIHDVSDARWILTKVDQGYPVEVEKVAWAFVTLAEKALGVRRHGLWVEQTPPSSNMMSAYLVQPTSAGGTPCRLSWLIISGQDGAVKVLSTFTREIVGVWDALEVACTICKVGNGGPSAEPTEPTEEAP